MIVTDRVQLYVGQVVTLLTGAQYVWQPSTFPRRTGNAAVVTCRVVTGPTITGTQLRTVEEPTSMNWALTSVSGFERVGLEVGGAFFFADAPEFPNVSIVRNAVLADLQARPRVLPEVTAASSGSDGIVITGPVGRLWTPNALGAGASITVTATQLCESETGSATLELEFQAYATGSSASAQELIGRITGGIRRFDVVEAGSRLGIGFQGPADPPFDLTALAGPDWESRCAARVTVVLRSYQSTPVEAIESVVVTPTYNGVVASSFTVLEADA